MTLLGAGGRAARSQLDVRCRAPYMVINSEYFDVGSVPLVKLRRDIASGDSYCLGCDAFRGGVTCEASGEP